MNGGDRPPEIIAVFCFPADDGGIGLGEAEEGEQAESVSEAGLTGATNRSGNLMPMTWRSGCITKIRPEMGDYGLFRRAKRAVATTKGFNLVKGNRICTAR